MDKSDTKWSKYVTEGMRSFRRTEALLVLLQERGDLSQEEAERVRSEVKRDIAALSEGDVRLAEDGKTFTLDGRPAGGVMQKGLDLLDFSIRRTWAERIRAEFAPHHDHAESTPLCAACGALAAADFMDPDEEGR